MMTLSLAGITATQVRLVTPWVGAWFAEVELDLETTTAPLPSGRVVLTIGDEALVGRVDARATELMKPIIAASTTKPADVTAADGAAKALVTACGDAAKSIPATKVYGG